jgi:hypothetical protein
VEVYGILFTGFNWTWVHAIFDVLIWHECYLMPQEAALFVVAKHVPGHTGGFHTICCWVEHQFWTKMFWQRSSPIIIAQDSCVWKLSWY